MRRAAALLAIAATLTACGPKSGQGLHKNQLDNLIAAAVGDPSTCVLLADGKTGQVVYRYGDDFNCTRPLPACDSSATMNAHAALKFAAQPGGRMQSCNSVANGSRTVGWAEGKVASTRRDLSFSAVMEGQNALPGHEINARLYDAFQKAGL
jgi:uncharacterized Zn-binding protein involved in type VI secretion